ncbi:uncharacterized protein V1518DRAFT_408298 [Limtongia smithiae]|uniref:uncharacterized protein n=1 Tax=Limtongia smithiae TaxID=1125753 RepID=UPI0034CD0945
MSKPPRGQQLAAPPSIPQSEEIKYKQKCKDLKRRIREIEDDNGVLTLRLARSKRAVQRMRLERALLLEKLEERTFLKVDDSEGSPSPPPSPPRIHKHRRRLSDVSMSPSGDSGATGGFTAFSNAGNAISSNISAGGKGVQGSSTSGAAPAGASSSSSASKKKPVVARDPNAPKRPQNAYIIFCDHEKERVRAQLEQGHSEPFDLTRAMAEAWRDLGDEGRKPFYDLYDAEKARYNREMEAYVAPGSLPPMSNSATPAAAGAGRYSSPAPHGNETDAVAAAGVGDGSQADADSPAQNESDSEDEEDEEMEDASFGGGFTAVNR